MLDYAFGAGDYYNSVDDLLSDDSLLEVDLVIKGLKKRLRIRALSYAQMEKINSISQKSGEIDTTEFTINTIVEGLIRPKLNSAQAKRLLDANGEVVRELAENIWTLGKVSKDAFDKYIQALNKDSELQEPEPDRGTTPSA